MLEKIISKDDSKPNVSIHFHVSNNGKPVQFLLILASMHFNPSEAISPLRMKSLFECPFLQKNMKATWIRTWDP